MESREPSFPVVVVVAVKLLIEGFHAENKLVGIQRFHSEFILTVFAEVNEVLAQAELTRFL